MVYFALVIAQVQTPLRCCPAPGDCRDHGTLDIEILAP